MKNIERVFEVSERRALRAVGWPRSTHRYRSVAPDQAALRLRLRELAASRPRFGYRRLWILLRREGWEINHKRVYRLYTQEGLSVRVQKRKKLVSKGRVPLPRPRKANELWSMDFMADQLSSGERFRILTLIDVYTRESLAVRVARHFPARKVTRVLENVIAWRGKPGALQLDNGTEFTSRHFDAWAYFRGVQVKFIRPGRPVENGHIESFNGRVRDECLNAQWFETLDDARRTLEDWRVDYNEVRPARRQLHLCMDDDDTCAWAVLW